MQILPDFSKKVLAFCRGSDIVIHIKAATTQPEPTKRNTAMNTTSTTSNTTATVSVLATKTTRYQAGRKVVSLRTRHMLSWATIAEMLDISPRSARKLFQERVGEHQHHDHLLGKGGRFPAWYTTDAELPYIVEPGEINNWFKVEGADLAAEMQDA